MQHPGHLQLLSIKDTRWPVQSLWKTSSLKASSIWRNSPQRKDSWSILWLGFSKMTFPSQRAKHLGSDDFSSTSKWLTSFWVIPQFRMLSQRYTSSFMGKSFVSYQWVWTVYFECHDALTLPLPNRMSSRRSRTAMTTGLPIKWYSPLPGQFPTSSTMIGI